MQRVRWINTDYYTDEHRYRGHYVHWIRRLDDENDLDIKDVAEEYRGFLDAYHAFKATWKFEPRMSERPIYHPELRYGVTPDAEGLILSSRDPAIVELKSGEPNSGPPPWWTKIQTASQDMAVGAWDRTKGDYPHRRRVGVKLFRNGKFNAKEYDDPADYDKWIWCLNTCKTPPGAAGRPPHKEAAAV